PDSIEAVLEQMALSAPGMSSLAPRPQSPPSSGAPSLVAQPVLVRGPSTFERQAATLVRGEAPLASPLASAVAPNGVQPETSAPGFQVQIGAYQSASEAERQLTSVRERAAALLGSHSAVTQPVKQGDKTLYRARYAGFDAAGAAQACKELKAL